MTIKLPELTKKRLRWVFDNVYDTDIPPLFSKASTPAVDKKLLHTLRLMQLENLKHRTGECVDLFKLFNEPYFLETNSEGATIFLAMVLALKELYGLEDMELQRIVFGCH